MALALAMLLYVCRSLNSTPFTNSNRALASYRLLMTGVALMPSTHRSGFFSLAAESKPLTTCRRLLVTLGVRCLTL